MAPVLKRNLHDVRKRHLFPRDLYEKKIHFHLGIQRGKMATSLSEIKFENRSLFRKLNVMGLKEKLHAGDI